MGTEHVGNMSLALGNLADTAGESLSGYIMDGTWDLRYYFDLRGLRHSHKAALWVV